MFTHKLLLLAVAGSLGTLARYGLAGLVKWQFGSGYPWGTTVVNLVGCLAFGVVWGICEDRAGVSEARTIVLVGFMGAFTTFSSFVYETTALLEDSQYLWAVNNFAIQNFVGLAAMVAGLAIGRLI